MPVEEAAAGRHPVSPQRQGDGAPLGEVLDADAEGQRHGRGEAGAGKIGGNAAEGDANGQSLGDVVEGDRRDEEEDAASPGGVQPFRLVGPFAGVEVGKHTVHAAQEEAAGQKADGGGSQGMPPSCSVNSIAGASREK